MFVIYIGLDFRHLPVETREKFTFSKESLIAANETLNDEKSILENVILSTCNRTEIYAVVDQIHTGRYYLKRFLARWFNVPLEKINQWVVIGTESEAVTHLFRVATGLDSLIKGEPQILGQVKTAFFTAENHDTTGVIFKHLFQQAISFSKRMHTQFKVSELAATSYQTALHQIKQQFGQLQNCRLAVVGTGEMGTHIVKNASTMGFKKLILLNHTNEKAAALADQFDEPIEARPYEQLPAVAGSVDALVTAVSSQHPILDLTKLSVEDGRLKLIIDLGVPRNVTGVDEKGPVRYLNIDQLREVLAANSQEKDVMLQKISCEIPGEVADFYTWQKQLHVVPVIRQLRESSLQIQATAFDSLLRKLPELDAHERKVINKHMKSIVNQMIKGPIKEIKELSVDEDANVDLAFFCDIFGLSKTFINQG